MAREPMVVRRTLSIAVLGCYGGKILLVGREKSDRCALTTDYEEPFGLGSRSRRRRLRERRREAGGWVRPTTSGLLRGLRCLIARLRDVRFPIHQVFPLQYLFALRQFWNMPYAAFEAMYSALRAPTLPEKVRQD